MDLYNADDISEAMVCLLDDIASLQSTVKLPHVPQRRDGDNRISQKVDDIIIIIIVRQFLTRRNTTKTLQGRAATIWLTTVALSRQQ